MGYLYRSCLETDMEGASSRHVVGFLCPPLSKNMSDLFLLLSFLLITITILVVFVLAIRQAWRNNNKRIQDELAWEKENKDKNKNENEPTLLQELRKKFNNNKIFNYVGIISVVLGIVGWFIAGIIIGIITLIIASAAKKDKQRFAILGIILGIVDICGAILLPLFRSGFSSQSIAQIIIAGVVGVAWTLISDNQMKQAEIKYQMNKSKNEKPKQ